MTATATTTSGRIAPMTFSPEMRRKYKWGRARRNEVAVAEKRFLARQPHTAADEPCPRSTLHRKTGAGSGIGWASAHRHSFGGPCPPAPLMGQGRRYSGAAGCGSTSVTDK